MVDAQHVAQLDQEEGIVRPLRSFGLLPSHNESLGLGLFVIARGAGFCHATRLIARGLPSR